MNDLINKQRLDSFFILIAFTFYWAAILILKYGSYSQIAPNFENSALIFGTIGTFSLFLTLFVLGLVPSVFSSPLGRQIVRIIPFGACGFVGILIVVQQSGFSFDFYIWVFARFIITVGFGCILAQIIPFLAKIGAFESAVVIATSFFVGALFCLCLIGVQAYVSGYILLSFFLIAATSTTFISLDRLEQQWLEQLKETSSRQKEDSYPQTHEFVNSNVIESSKLPRGFWSLTAGLLFYSLIYGMSVAIVPYLDNTGEMTLPFGSLLFIPGSIMFFIMLKKGAVLNLSQFQWFLFVPILIGLLLILNDSPLLSIMGCALLAITFTCYDIANIIILVNMARGHSWSVVFKVIVWGRAANFLGMCLGGLVIIPFISDSFIDHSKLNILITAAIVSLALGVAFLGRFTFSKNITVTKSVEHHSNGNWKKSCAILCQEYGLSQREKEVFILLSKGRIAENIADKLFIAPSTVKSHTHRIYQKMQIHSQQELIDRVEEALAKQLADFDE